MARADNAAHANTPPATRQARGRVGNLVGIAKPQRVVPPVTVNLDLDKAFVDK